MSDLVGNPEDRFSHNEAHLIPCCKDINVIANSVACDQTGLQEAWEQSDIGLHSLY